MTGYKIKVEHKNRQRQNQKFRRRRITAGLLLTVGLNSALQTRV